MSNWKNELEICWNKLKCNFFKNYSHLDSKRQKSSTRTTLYFYHFYVSTKVNMNKFETNELMSNWKNELEICWNKLKCNFFKNYSHLDSKRQKSSTRTTLYFYHFYVSTKVNMNKFETNELMSNWKNELEICWNKLKCNFFKNYSLLDSKRQKSSTRTTLYFYHFYVSTKVNMNKFETNELMSNWKNELEICWNKLKCNFFKNHSHLDSKRQKSSTRTTLYFYHFYVSTKVSMNKFETNELMSNWKNELEICWNKLKCNFFKNHSHLDSKRQKSSTHTTLYFYHFYVSTKVNMNKFETNELMSNWKNELEICWNKLKYVEINWNVIFSKIILILILKHKRAVPVPLYFYHV